ncbi:MAG: hypothetical protein ACOVOW_11770 [Spirosomataceae bacterium]
MSHTPSFPWTDFFLYTGICTLACWASFFFYDYFITGSQVKENIYDNPIAKKAKSVDTRPQITTDTVEFDSMLKTK